MFIYIFLLDPSLKSTFAQKQSCRSSLPLQLLFWPNFKFLYEILSFIRSKSSPNQSNGFTVPPCGVTVSPMPILRPTTGDDTRRPSRRTSASERARSYPSPTPRSPFLLIPLLSFFQLTPSRVERSSPPASLRPPLDVYPDFLAPQATQPRPSPPSPIPELD